MLLVLERKQGNNYFFYVNVVSFCTFNKQTLNKIKIKLNFFEHDSDVGPISSF